MKRSNLNFVIDALLMLVLSAIIGIGFLLKYVLLTGRQKWEKLGANPDQTFLLLDRHQWGTVHLILGFIMAGLMVLHIYFHWCQIKVMYKCLMKNSGTRKIVAVPFILGCFFLIFYPFLISPTTHAIEQGGGYGKRALTGAHKAVSSGRRDSLQNGPETEEVPASRRRGSQQTGYDPCQAAPAGRRDSRQSVPEPQTTMKNGPAAEENATAGENHDHERGENRKLEIRGYMTVGEVCAKYGISRKELCTRLGLDTVVGAELRMSTFRRRYGIRMSTVEEAILESKGAPED